MKFTECQPFWQCLRSVHLRGSGQAENKAIRGRENLASGVLIEVVVGEAIGGGTRRMVGGAFAAARLVSPQLEARLIEPANGGWKRATSILLILLARAVCPLACAAARAVAQVS